MQKCEMDYGRAVPQFSYLYRPWGKAERNNFKSVECGEAFMQNISVRSHRFIGIWGLAANVCLCTYAVLCAYDAVDGQVVTIV